LFSRNIDNEVSGGWTLSGVLLTPWPKAYAPTDEDRTRIDLMVAEIRMRLQEEPSLEQISWPWPDDAGAAARAITDMAERGKCCLVLDIWGDTNDVWVSPGAEVEIVDSRDGELR
jgi:hypothetical protein